MKYLHTMIRVQNLEKALHFFVDVLGLQVSRKKDYPEGKFTLVFLSTGEENASEIELTYNWDQAEAYTVGRNFGHLAYEVDDIYDFCEKIQSMGVVISRPPRDGRMAFVRSPDSISIELLQKGNPLPPKEPWVSMPNTGEW
ncbi:lactoylglutathione lyase [Leptospira biflexa]|jgi:lactoylglutathione lyase|uniref:Aldoketomutase n=1 Tax=Leptospira biflexa serovar Patoc (strain Patoc 1 / ATCC 23582 / Paris) TaxID=456481 RepID=B0SL86_LEPBP|nr:VOC family protein [Leptospira biflexa]ABZ93270.1 Lactoylglutathione-related lyase [Leptospira biflexa serovar Patoc strain 'Patoc 1 (Ames)']ABZ96893.1 Lactoylglutathione lyase [Leptospira biflexa serovar Patoc strain 'Patoc 1 (Paris)']TGM38161.1 lactoylglutathione lyase [Leptospira biflexa]TGM41492.1 lactoylglutathione lyase [Leptospira biflexa]TGM47694.1 lactoylglutathione lyase [Leptospira biflexa]